MKKLVSIAAIALLALQGCGSSGGSKKQTAVTPTVTQPPVVEEVHIIAPDKVAEYVANYQQLKSQLQLEFDGEQFAIEMLDMDMQNNLVIARYAKGVAVIGFNLNEEKPLNSLLLLEGTLDANDEFTGTPRRLENKALNVSEEGESYVYSGDLTDAETQGKYPVRLVFNEALVSGGTSKLVVDGDRAILTGDLGTGTYKQLQDLINNNPGVKTLVLQNIGGSVNDAINMHNGRLVRNAQLTTLMPADGEAYSGGVDLFISGAQRQYETGGKLGVHSWCCEDGKAANELSKDDPAHGAQLTYVREMLGAEDGPAFYFFTLEAAPFDGIHVMTEAELKKYKMIE